MNIHSSLENFIEDLKPTLTGYFILEKLFPNHKGIVSLYPPQELTEEQVDTLQDYLNDAIPLNTMITDLWDWDLHFENDIDSDWYYEAVFGTNDSVKAVTEQLVEYFLEKVEEYKMDYDQGDDPNAFRNLVMDEATKFIISWRKNIQVKIGQQPNGIK